MKRFIQCTQIFVCICILLMNAVACTQQPIQEENSNIQVTDQKETEKNDATTRSPSTAPQAPDVQESVPVHEMFSSFDELRRLVEAVDQGEEAYAALEDDYDLEFREAQMLAEQVRELSVPVLNSAREPERFLMDFYVEENYLDIVYYYGDNEASYYFTYYFDSVPRQRDDPILYTVTLDDISVGLFQVNGGYGGSVALGKDQFVVFIRFTGDANEAAFTLDQFDLVPLFPNAE